MIVSLFHVIVVSEVVFDVLDEELLLHDDFFFHCATKFAHHRGIFDGNSGFHHLNLYPALVGLAGAVILASYFAVIDSTSLPPLASNVIVYLSLS